MPAVFSHPGKLAGVHHDAWQPLVRLQPRVGGGGQRVEVLCPQRFGDLDDQHPGLRLEVVGDAGALRQRAQPGDGLRAFGHAEDAQREGQEEGHDVAPLAEPVKIGHHRVAVEQPQQ